MNEGVLFVKECIQDVALYAMPIAAFLLSVLALIKSNKIKKMEEKLNEYDLKLKKYELEKIEQEKNKKNEACIEARIVKISGDKYRIKIWNSGTATAYNVDYDIPDEYQIILMKRVTPFEILEPGHNFEEHVIIHMQSENKYKVITSWQDKDGNDFNKEQLKTW
ncbi:MAG: hypothetical protein J6C06_04570 [Lachnospiraceae bacterium]|nr:hypothetical protein [Lachnospiraceae bacterium]